jgi:hypothetical protein
MEMWMSGEGEGIVDAPVWVLREGNLGAPVWV